MTTSPIEALLVEEIVAACPELAPEEVSVDASLTGHLGLDSLSLSSLFSTIRAHFGHIELAPWFIAASNAGRDTIGSLARFIAERRPLAVAA
jgi:acyl carrier protein